jgi:hypothetical protein
LLSFSAPPSGTGIAAFLTILYSTEHAVMTSKFVDSLNLSCCRKQGKRLFHIPNTFSIFTRFRNRKGFFPLMFRQFVTMI